MPAISGRPSAAGGSFQIRCSNVFLTTAYQRFLRYPIWRLISPTAPYEQFYADIVKKRLARQQDHAAIGRNARPIRSSTELLDVMTRHGMQPHHRFIDYGCGSLRLGKAIVEFLDARKFRGMDVDQAFLNLAADFVGPELMTEKRPFLDVIGDGTLVSAREGKPDYIGSWHVCSKIPDRHLKRYFGSLIGLMWSGSQTFIQFPATDQRRRLNNLNWTLSTAQLAEIVRSISPEIAVDFIEIVPRNDAGVTETYAHLHFAKA